MAMDLSRERPRWGRAVLLSLLAAVPEGLFFARFGADGHIIQSLLLTVCLCFLLFAAQRGTRLSYPSAAVLGVFSAMLALFLGHFLAYNRLVETAGAEGYQKNLFKPEMASMAGRERFALEAGEVLDRATDGGFWDSLAYRAKKGVLESTGKNRSIRRRGAILWIGWVLQVLLFLLAGLSGPAMAVLSPGKNPPGGTGQGSLRPPDSPPN